MSNMSPFGNAKNTPWGRTSVGNPSANLVNQTNPLQQQLLNQGALGTLNTSGMVQFQQQHQQVFQNAMGMQQQNLGIGLQPMGNPAVAVSASGLGTQIPSNQIFQQVTYPNPRALNPTAFQTQGVNTIQQQNTSNTSTKQRVFTGTVTKVHDNFGFVDEDVFFQTTACVKGSNPMVGDRVLVEASYNSNMPFKWNATRIQVLPMTNQSSVRNSNAKSFNSNSNSSGGSSGYNAVPPPNDGSNGNFGRNTHRNKGNVGGRRERSRDKDREEEEIERKRRREERIREREKEEKKSPLRRRSRSPKARRRSRIVPRYMVQIPKIALDL